jgi:YD repeat-containing protein
LLVEEVWRNGLRFYFRYEGEKTGSRCIETWGSENLLHYSLQYLEAGLTQATNSLGHTSRFYHRGGLVYHTIGANGGEAFTYYNEYNELVEEVDALGQSTAHSYDEWGNRVYSVYPDNATLQLTYNDKGQPLSAVDSLGGRWRWRYDGCGNLLKKTDPLGPALNINTSGDCSTP